jgi:hypothetical protein
VIADIVDARTHGARSIFLVDDNITLDVEWFSALGRAIVDAGLDRLDYIVQASAARWSAAAPFAARNGRTSPDGQRSIPPRTRDDTAGGGTGAPGRNPAEGRDPVRCGAVHADPRRV